MRPPLNRHFTGGKVEQVRPSVFGGRHGIDPPNNRIFDGPVNTMSPMYLSCQRSHADKVRPLRDVNQYREHVQIGFGGRPPVPQHVKNPKIVPHVLVHAFE